MHDAKGLNFDGHRQTFSFDLFDLALLGIIDGVMYWERFYGSVPRIQSGRMLMSQINYRGRYDQFIVASTHVLPV